MMRRLRTFWRSVQGSAAVEAAVVVPVLFTLGLGAAESGNLIAENHRIKTGLAAGARLLARAGAPENLEASARNLAVTGVTNGGTSRVAGWTVASVQVSYRWVDNSLGTYAGGEQIRIVRLETTRPYRGLGLFRLPGGLNLTDAHEERWTGGGA